MVRLSKVLLKDGGRVIGISKTLSEMLVCPISKQSLRYCEESNSLISDTIGVSFPIMDGIPCLVPMDAKIIQRRIRMIIKKLVLAIYNFRIKDISLPWELLGKGSNNGGGGVEMCCVCLCGMEEGEERRVLTCRHEFHGQCIGRWFDGRRITCPICRRGDHHTEMMMMNDKQFLTEEMLVWFSSFHVAGF